MIIIAKIFKSSYSPLPPPPLSSSATIAFVFFDIDVELCCLLPLSVICILQKQLFLFFLWYLNCLYILLVVLVCKISLIRPVLKDVLLHIPMVYYRGWMLVCLISQPFPHHSLVLTWQPQFSFVAFINFINVFGILYNCTVL